MLRLGEQVPPREAGLCSRDQMSLAQFSRLAAAQPSLPPLLPTAVEPGGVGLSEQAPFYDEQGGGSASLEAVAAWIADALRQDNDSSMTGGACVGAAHEKGCWLSNALPVCCGLLRLLP